MTDVLKTLFFYCNRITIFVKMDGMNISDESYHRAKSAFSNFCLAKSGEIGVTT